MNNTPAPIDYAFIISELEAKLHNDIRESEVVQEKIMTIDKNLKSPIIVPEYAGENKLDKEMEMRELISFQTTLIANISVNQKILERYKKVHQTWEEKYSLIYKEAMEGGSKKLIEQARQINNPDLNRKLNEYEAGMNDKNRNRDEKAQAYSAFKNLVELYQK